MCSCAEVPILLLTSNLLYWRYIGYWSINIHQLDEDDKQHSHLVPSMSLLRSVKPIRRVCVNGQDSIPIAANASIHPTAAPKHKKSTDPFQRRAGRGKRGSEKAKKIEQKARQAGRGVRQVRTERRSAGCRIDNSARLRAQSQQGTGVVPWRQGCPLFMSGRQRQYSSS